MLVERRSRLDTEIAVLERERPVLSEVLATKTLALGQLGGLQEFVDQVRAGLEKAGTDLEPEGVSAQAPARRRPVGRGRREGR
jgi:hypothetical protein